MGENLSSGFQTRFDPNQTVKPQKMALGLKFPIKEVEGLYCLCSENKVTDQLLTYYTADLHSLCPGDLHSLCPAGLHSLCPADLGLCFCICINQVFYDITLCKQ